MEKKSTISLFFIFIFLINNNLFADLNQYNLERSFFPLHMNDSVAKNEGEFLSVSLMTIAPGSKLFELYFWWGHTALIIEDSRTNQKTIYDFGVFSIPSNRLILSFLKGQVDYVVSATPGRYLDAMTNNFLHDNRWVVIQPLNLEPQKAYSLNEYLKTNCKGINRIYKYKFFTENCCTKIRDLINFATDGALFDYTNKTEKKSLRAKAQEYVSKSFMVDWGLQFLLSSSIDKQATRWDHLFLPYELMRAVSELNYKTSSGKTVKLSDAASQQLPPGKLKELAKFGISGSQGVMVSDPAVIKTGKAKTWLLALCVGIIIGTIAALLFLFGTKSLVVRILGGIYMGVILLLLFVISLILAYMAFFSSHDITYNNLNLILINPLTMLIAFVLTILYGANVKKGQIIYTWFWLIMSLGAITMLVLDLCNVFIQDCLPTTVAVLPLFLFMGISGFFRERFTKAQ